VAVLLVLVAAPAGAGPPTGLVDPVDLEGKTIFSAYAPMLGEMVVPYDNYCDATATLEPAGSNEAVLILDECDGYRIETWDVKLTHGGAVKMSQPGGAETLVLIAEHTGCRLNGTAPVYHGHFDGTHFNAVMHFHGACDGGTFWSPLFGVSEAMGPLHVTFIIDLTVE
jgi:hypothetical protein